MDLAKAVAILVPGILAVRVADRLVSIAPGLQTGVDVVLVGVDLAPRSDRGGDDRLDRPLPHIGQHAHDQLATGVSRILCAAGWLNDMVRPGLW